MEQALFHPVVDFGKISDGFFGTAGRQVLEKSVFLSLFRFIPLGMMTINALACVDSVLIPVQAAYLLVKGLQQLIKTIGRVKKQLNPKLKIEGILLTMVDNRTNYARDISLMVYDTYSSSIKVFGTEIPMSVRASEVSVEREKPKWDDTITNRMLHWSYTPEQKEEVKKALAAGVPKATILTYFYPEVTVEKMRSYRKKQ